MTMKSSSRRKFAQFVPNHVFCNEDRVEDLAVMHVESHADKIGSDHGAARPGFDGGFGLGVLGLLDFFQQMAVNKRALFN